jgi:hypothetical protein
MRSSFRTAIRASDWHFDACRGGQIWLELKGTLPPRREGPPLHVHYEEVEEGRVTAGTLSAVMNGHRLRVAVLFAPRWIQPVLLPLIVLVGTALGRYRGTNWPGCPDRCTRAPLVSDGDV